MRLPSIPQPEKLLELAAAKSAGEGALFVSARLEEVVRGFPNFDELDPFTSAMMGTTLDRDKIKQSLGRLQGVQKTIRRLGHLQKKEFLGRLKSILRKLSPSLKILAEAKDFLKRIPDPTAHYTVCLAGYPNAGKSTLLKKLTGAKAEIANYDFTTKSLNYGTTEVKHFPVQFVDTPGTLNREKTNAIEKQAILALKHLADSIVFVYDPMREDDESQRKLFLNIKKYDLPLAIYASKQDLVEKIPTFAKGDGNYKLFTQPKDILKWIEPEVIKRSKEDIHIVG